MRTVQAESGCVVVKRQLSNRSVSNHRQHQHNRQEKLPQSYREQTAFEAVHLHSLNLREGGCRMTTFTVVAESSEMRIVPPVTRTTVIGNRGALLHRFDVTRGAIHVGMSSG